MASHTLKLNHIVRVFLDLAIANFLLFVSASLFRPLKCLSLFGPCSCDSHRTHNLCLHKFLFHWPVRTIYSVHNLAKRRFGYPFDQSCNGFAEFEACSRSKLPDKESCGYPGKGVRVVNQKQRAGIRRRRKAQSGYGNTSSSRSVMANDGSATEGLHMSERTEHGFETRVEFGESKDMVNGFSCNAQDKPGIIGTEVNRVKILERGLEDEKALRITLYLELEKERAAAATSADEAVAMITRLQTEKASIEMEARHYQRMIEEKSAYDEGEMNILKEILVRREKENHFLEKEVESYRHMELSENDSDGDRDEGKNRVVQSSKYRPRSCGGAEE